MPNIKINGVYPLKKDIISIAKKGHVYAKAGEMVKILSISHDVAIAESLKGVKMPISLIDDI